MFNPIQDIWACPSVKVGGSGYPLQVLTAFRAFRCYPSREATQNGFPFINLQHSIMHIRAIKSSDNALLATMIRRVFVELNLPKEGTVYSDPTTDQLFETFQHPRAALYVVEVEGQPVGCCGIYPTEGLPEGWVELGKYYLSSACRGKGYGRLLMERCIAAAKEMQFTHLYLESFPSLDKAMQLYEDFGFYFLPMRLGHSGHTACNVWMAKELV